MAWSAPSSRSTGELITAAIWNQDVVDNVTYIHDREYTFFDTWVKSPSETTVGDFRVSDLNNAAGGSDIYFLLTVPSDFDTLQSLEIVFIASTSTTYEYDVTTDYAADGETYNTHSESATNQTVAVTADKIDFLDISGVVSSLAAGDTLGVVFTNSNGANAGTWQVIGIKFAYTRA